MAGSQTDTAERPGPPATALGMASIALVAAGVIYLASYLPRRAPLGPAIGLLVAAVVVLATSVALLALQKEFAWWRFFQVGRWTLLAYVVIAGMIEFAFIYDHTRGSPLVLLTLLLFVFMLNAPVLMAFTVARFADPIPPAGDAG